MDAPNNTPLNARQQKFVACYTGNGTQAVRLAGYTGSENTLNQTAFELLRNPKISAAIKAKDDAELGKLLADSNEIKAMWSDTMRNDRVPIESRLRAGELLVKSRGGFIERHEHSGRDGQPIEVNAGTDLSHISEEALLRMAGITDVPKGGYRTGSRQNGHATSRPGSD